MSSLVLSYDVTALPVMSLVSQVKVERRPWFYNDDRGRQVGGFVKEFENMAFVTVKVKKIKKQKKKHDFIDPACSCT